MVHWRRHGSRVSLRHAAAQQVGTRAVWRRQLVGLGLYPNAAELELHALLQYARFGPVTVAPPEAGAARPRAERLEAAKNRFEVKARHSGDHRRMAPRRAYSPWEPPSLSRQRERFRVSTASSALQKPLRRCPPPL